MFSFVETKLFTRLVEEYLTDDEYRLLQAAMLASPKAGKVIRGSGGIRKLRWRTSDGGKRGGYRVIYFAKHAQGVFWMLTMYPKNMMDSIPTHVLKQILREMEDV